MSYTMVVEGRDRNGAELGIPPGPRRPRAPGPRPPHRHRHRRRGPFFYPEVYHYPSYYPLYPVDTIEDEVASLERRAECVPARSLRRAVADLLKGRGWVERMDERKVLLLCPPPAETRAPSVPMVKGLGQVKVGGPVVTAVEGVAAGVGVVIVLAGVALKSVHGIFADVMVAVGSSVTAASIFSAVSRRFES